MARASTRKRTAVNYNEDQKPTANGATDTKAKAKAASGATTATTATPSKAAATPKKRKAEPAETTPAAEPPTNKKRKAGKAKDEDAMPLAERTAAASLKKAMYIGAHVSAAGGKLAFPLSCVILCLPRMNRKEEGPRGRNIMKLTVVHKACKTQSPTPCRLAPIRSRSS